MAYKRETNGNLLFHYFSAFIWLYYVIIYLRGKGLRFLTDGGEGGGEA